MHSTRNGRRASSGEAEYTLTDPWPIISIVTPSFNQAQFLERTIQSILSQGYPALEYIIVDGGSTDNSLEIIERYADRLKWWASGPDGGQAEAIARGFDHSTGEILCWVNSDDVLLPGALQAVGDYFRSNPRAEVVTGAAYCIDEADRPIRHLLQCTYTRGVHASASRFMFYGQDGVYQQATFWRSTAYFAVGGMRKSLSFAMDLDLFTRLAQRKRFGVISRYLACFRLHDASKSSTLEHIRKEEVALLRLDRSALGTHPLLRRILFGWYRTISLLRKSILQGRAVLGFEQFPPIAKLSPDFGVRRDA
ncbi:MAG: glycosyltransferase family 2 protein [Terracidiphilus sp.]|jgi:glycosyltransferase involved in cell wall biosynthesis